MSDTNTTTGQGVEGGSQTTQTSSQTSTEGSLLGGSATSGKTTETSATSTGWLTEDGKFADGWIDRLGDDFKADKGTLSQFKDLNGLLKTVASQQKLLGKKADAVFIPSEDATPEEKATFLKKLGLPDSPDVYATKPKDLPKDFEWDEGLAKEFNKIAHESGILPHQMEKIISRFAQVEMGRASDTAAAAKAAFEAEKKELSEAWGDRYSTNEATATRMAQSVGLPLDTKQWTQSKMVIALARAAELISDDKLVPMVSGATQQPGKMRGRDIITNQANPLYAAYHGKQGVQKQLETASLVMDLLKQG